MLCSSLPQRVSFAHWVSFLFTRLSFLFFAVSFSLSLSLCLGLFLCLSFSLSVSLSIRLSLFLSGEAHVPSRPRVLRTYVHTRSRTADLSFPTPLASGRRPIGPYPAQKHRTAHDRACNESGVRALRWGGAGRGETKKSFRIKTGKQKNNQISAYIINEDMCVRACSRPRLWEVWTAEKVLTSIGIRRADACHCPPPSRLFPFILLRIRLHFLFLLLLLLLLLFWISANSMRSTWIRVHVRITRLAMRSSCRCATERGRAAYVWARGHPRVVGKSAENRRCGAAVRSREFIMRKKTGVAPHIVASFV